MKQLAVTTCTCDNKYVDVFKVFLVSMRIHNGQELTIKADLYNGNEDIYRGYRKIYKNLDITHHSLPGEDWEVEDKTLMIMRPRIKRIYDLLLEGHEQILFIDCDTIIRHNLDGIWHDVESNSIKIWDRGGKREKSGRARFQAGVHIYGNGEATREYYKDWLNDIGENWQFFDGQRQMYFTWLKHKEKVKLINLDKKYNDLHYGKDSHIWHARHTHLDEWPFKIEFDYYLKQAEELYAQAEY